MNIRHHVPSLQPSLARRIAWLQAGFRRSPGCVRSGCVAAGFRALFLLAMGAAALVSVQPVLGATTDDGVTADAIVLSRVISLGGPAGAKGREQEEALHAYFNAINASGGIHGRKIVLRTTDMDLRTEAAVAKIYSEQRPFAFFLVGGTVGGAATMSYASTHGVPFLAPNTGAIAFHQPPKKYVFNVRATYQDEIIAAIRQFSTVNQRKLALVFQDDAFGRDAADGYREGTRTVPGITSLYDAGLAADGSNIQKHASELARVAPDAVVAVGSAKRVAELIKAARQAGVAATFMTLSNNATIGFAEELGEHGRGVIVGQVTPPGSGSSKMGRELRQLLGKPHGAPVSYASMEAYASAKVLIEGLKRAGPNLTREGFIKALESIRRLDLGGMEVDYSPVRRSGSNFVDLSILTQNGKYLR